jgi:hypothetical protein
VKDSDAAEWRPLGRRSIRRASGVRVPGHVVDIVTAPTAGQYGRDADAE